MKTKAAAAANKATVDEDDGQPKKIRSSRRKRRHARRSSTESESPPRKRSKKPSKRTADKKSKRGKVSSSSSRQRRRSPSPSPSLSSSSPSSASTRSSSSDPDRSVSPPPRSQSRDVKKRKDRDRDRERDPRRRKAWKSRSSRSTSSSGSSRSRSKSSKQLARDKIGKQYDNRRASMSEKNITDYFDRDEEAVVAAKKGCYEIERYEMNVSLEKTENPLSRNANETEDILPDDGGSPVTENLELILRQKALENFRKFRAAAATAGKTDDGATQKEILTDSPQNAGTKVAESRSAAITPPRGQASSLGARHPTESPKSEDYGNRKSPWMQKSSAAMSHGAGSPSRILKNGDTGGLTKQGGSTIEATHSTSQPRSPQDGRNSHSVMQRLVDTPGGASSANQRLGSSAGARNVNGAPRIKSVVSIPTREGYDGGTTPQGGCENFAPVESSSEIRHALIDINKAEGTDGDDRKVSEASASNPSVLSPAEGKRQVTEARIEDKDGSQFQKKTFSRMHDGETVEVSYKVYIPKKTPALARRKLQR